jgi:predicted TIM-barrel fold metal-dependent hydrolase
MKVVDCDTHFWQPLDVWQDHIDPAWREKVKEAHSRIRPPFVAINTQGGVKPGAPVAAGATKESRLNDWSNFQAKNERAYLIRGGDHPDARIEWMDEEGIDACIIYPTLAAGHAYHPDIELSTQAARGLNRWAADFASYAPKRLVPCFMLPWHDPERALAELDGALKLGMKVAFSAPTPSRRYRWSHRAYDPLWKALQDNNVTMTFHDFTRMPGADSPLVAREAYSDNYMMMYLCGHTVEPQVTLMDLMLGGVFNRFPRLRMVFVEAHIAWLPGWLASMDQQWERTKSVQDVSDWPDTDMTPTELFRRQGAIVAFPDDNWLKQTIEHVSDDNILICSDYPHPQTRYQMVKEFASKYPALSAGTREKILGGNACRFFGLN